MAFVYQTELCLGPRGRPFVRRRSGLRALILFAVDSIMALAFGAVELALRLAFLALRAAFRIAVAVPRLALRLLLAPGRFLARRLAGRRREAPAPPTLWTKPPRPVGLALDDF